jgi:hypothetical protein
MLIARLLFARHGSTLFPRVAVVAVSFGIIDARLSDWHKCLATFTCVTVVWFCFGTQAWHPIEWQCLDRRAA